MEEFGFSAVGAYGIYTTVGKNKNLHGPSRKQTRHRLDHIARSMHYHSTVLYINYPASKFLLVPTVHTCTTDLRSIGSFCKAWEEIIMYCTEGHCGNRHRPHKPNQQHSLTACKPEEGPLLPDLRLQRCPRGMIRLPTKYPSTARRWKQDTYRPNAVFCILKLTYCVHGGR